MIYTEPFIPKKQNIHFFQMYMEHFKKIDNMVGHKKTLNRLKKIQIISIIFSDHNGLKLEISFKEKNSKTSKFMETE